MEHNPNPGVKCGVFSCQFHDEHNHCLKQRIQVNPQPNGAGGAAEDESICGSYKIRK